MASIHSPAEFVNRPGGRDPVPTVMVGTDWHGLLDSATRGILEERALSSFLTRQRWFVSKSREMRHVRFTDWTTIVGGTHPAFLTMVSAQYADGWVDTYLVPLATLPAEAAAAVEREHPHRVLARIGGARKGGVIDGFGDDTSRNRLVQLIADSASLVSSRGSLRGFLSDSSRHDQVEHLVGTHTWHAPDGDQSNSLAFFDDRYAFKLFRRIEPGPNPEFELPQALAARGFTRTPPIVGALFYERQGFESGTMALLQELVRHQGTAWDFAVSNISRYFDRIAARPGGNDDIRENNDENDDRDETDDRIDPRFLDSMTTLGRRTAEMHRALRDQTEPALAPEPLDAAALRVAANEMGEHAGASLALLQQRIGALEGRSRNLGEQVLAVKEQLLEAVQAPARLQAPAGARIRIHGDYHLGQVLRTEEDFVILDFEGEPGRPLEVRRAKQSPLKDVAGMIRSLSYAAYTGLFAFTAHSPERPATLHVWAETWQHQTSDAFVSGYQATLADSALLPAHAVYDTLLNAFVLDKALYELSYELNSRPDWVGIPLAGILKLI